MKAIHNEERLFERDYGIIPACDVETLDELAKLVGATSTVNGIVGYKVGAILGLTYGLANVVGAIKEQSNLPILYDHQKAGTDIPQLAEEFTRVWQEAGVAAAIVFPQAGPETEEALLRAIIGQGMIAIVGGEMTHPRYLSKDGGYLSDDAPARMYKVAADIGVTHFVVPGNRPGAVEKYAKLIGGAIQTPRFLLPGIGRQGGDIETAFAATLGHPAYAIIGSGIYKAADVTQAAGAFCQIALHFETEGDSGERAG